MSGLGPWAVDPNDPVIVPNTAGGNDPAVIITGNELPPCMQGIYTAGVLWRPANTQTGTLNNDSPLYFTAVTSLSTSPVGQVHTGVVIHDPVLGYCDFKVFRTNVFVNDAGALSYHESLGPDALPNTRVSEAWNYVDFSIMEGLLALTNGTDTNTGYYTYSPQYATASAILGVTAVLTPIVGTQLTVNTLRTTDVIKLNGVIDFDRIAAGAGTCFGKLLVDGVALASNQQIIFNASTIGNRSTVSQNWEVTGLSPGAHTFELAAATTGAAGVYRALNLDSTLSITAHY